MQVVETYDELNSEFLCRRSKK